MSTKTTAKKTINGQQQSANNQKQPAKNKVSPIRGKSQGNQSGYSQWLRHKKVFGYLHSVREIPDSFPTKIGATISVPQGENLDRNWELFQVVVNSYDAHMLFNEYKVAVEDKETNVTVRFDVTNTRSGHFIVEEGADKGKIVDCIDCTLTNLSSMSINGDVVYNQEDKISVSAQQYYSENNG